MPLTIVDYLNPQECPDGFVVTKLAGTVKIAWQVKPAGTVGDKAYGQTQGFILANSDGELQCQLKDTENGGGFAPVAKGDQVEIFSTPHGRTAAPSGNKLRSYQKDGKTVRCLDIFGLKHLKNLSRPAADQPAYTGGQNASGASSGQAQQQRRVPTLTEAEALATYWRLFGSIAASYSPKVSAAATSIEGFIIEAPVELLDIVHRAALTIYMGIQDGKVKGAATAPAGSTSGGKHPDPDWATEPE